MRAAPQAVIPGGDVRRLIPMFGHHGHLQGGGRFTVKGGHPKYSHANVEMELMDCR